MSISDYLKDMWRNPAKYNKFWIALITAIITILTDNFPESDLVTGVVSVAGAVGVCLIPNVKVSK